MNIDHEALQRAVQKIKDDQFAELMREYLILGPKQGSDLMHEYQRQCELINRERDEYLAHVKRQVLCFAAVMTLVFGALCVAHFKGWLA